MSDEEYIVQTPSTISTTSVSEVYQKSDLIGGIFIPLEKSNNNLPKISSPKKTDEKPLDILTSEESNWHISISPDGENVLMFNHDADELEFKIIPVKNINDSYEEKSYDVKSVKKEESKNDPKWIIAISNSITNTLNEKEVLVAISRVTKSDTTSPGKKKNLNNENFTSTNDNEFEDKDPEPFEIVTTDTIADEGNTVIYKVKLNQNSKPERICCDLPGGIVIFVHNDDNDENSIYCFVFNVKGICRKKFTHDLSEKEMNQFNYPKRLQDELKSLYKKKSCIARLFNSIFDHYFFIEQYKEGIQFLQLYDLKTMEMKQYFDLHEGKFRKFGIPIFARSNNEKIIAFSFGFGKLFLFLVENGLEIASEDFGKGVKILFCDFINNDHTVIVIIQKPGYDSKQIYYWNLFSTNNHVKSGRKVNFVMDEENISSIARIPGKLITVDTDGNISSVFDRLINNCDPEEEVKEIHSIVIHNDNSKLVESPRKMSFSEAKCKISGKKHKIFHQKDSQEKEAKPFISNKEPWVMDGYDRTSVFLDEKETTQLFIGRSTIQVWRRNARNKINNKMELEYIWTNNIKADREEKCALKVDELYIGKDRSFYIKVRWDGLKDNEFFEVKWPYSDNHVTPIIHACNALEHLNYRRNKLVGHKKQYEFVDMKDRISYIIWKFIKNKPNIWRLMDVRFDIMAKVIIGGSNTLIKYILFGDGKDKNWNLHIPKINRWENEDEKKIRIETIEEKGETKIKNLSDLRIAIHLCKKGLECNRRSLIVAYLLEYYTENSLKHIGWLSTVSEALPDLSNRSDLKSFVKEIFFKRCISGVEISNMIDYTDLTPKEIEVTVKESQEFIAFNPNTKLISKDETQKSISLYLKEFYAKIFSSTDKLSPTVKIIPLRNFVCKGQEKHKNRTFLSKVFQYAFIPRGYLSDIGLSSPLVQIVRNEKDDDIFDNPAMEAAVNYKWGPTRNYYFRIFVTYILFAACFAALVGCYLGHAEATGHLRNFLVFLFILFYYSGIYLFLVECRQCQHHGWIYYLDFFNFVDLASIVASIVTVSIYITPSFKLSNAFADVVTTSNITAGFSFTMLLLWFEFILYLRLFSEPAKYLYIILNIIKKTYLFVVFMLLVVLALSHVFLLLLQHTDFSDLDDITSKTSSYTIQNSAGETVSTSEQDFNRKLDNPSKDFGTSFLSTYAWLRGSYPQQATWNFWAVEALTLIGSLFLITVVQNIFIAFIWAVYTEAFEKGRVALLRYRAELIADYETLDEIHFFHLPSEPKYIYYLGKSESYDTWEGIVKKRELKKLYEDLESKMNKTRLSFKGDGDENSFLNYKEVKEPVNKCENINGSRSDESLNESYENDDDNDVDNDDDDDDDDDKENVEDVGLLYRKVNEILQNIKVFH